MLYLGHDIGEGCMSVPQARVSAIAEYPLPNTKRQLRAFLGTIGYYREFVQGFAEHSTKLSPSVSLTDFNSMMSSWCIVLASYMTTLMDLVECIMRRERMIFPNQLLRMVLDFISFPR